MARQSAFRRRIGRDPIYSLSRDVSEVLNRVRRAFGHLPMKPASDGPEVRAAEAAVEQTARQVRLGEAGPAAWQHALAAYEAAWMAALKALRQDGKQAA